MRLRLGWPDDFALLRFHDFPENALLLRLLLLRILAFHHYKSLSYTLGFLWLSSLTQFPCRILSTLDLVLLPQILLPLVVHPQKEVRKATTL